MQNVRFVFAMPNKGAYVGGIACILQKYMDNQAAFAQNGYHISLLNDTVKTRIPRRGIFKFLFFFDMLRKTHKVKKELKKDAPSIVHIHSSRKGLLLMDLFLAAKLRKKHGEKLFLSIHFADMEKILYANARLRKWELAAMECCHKIIFLSKKTRDEFVKAGLSPQKTEVLYTFHSFGPQRPVKETRKDMLNMLFMGSIDRRKGILDLMKALAALPDIPYKLHICGQLGDSSIKEAFENACQTLGDKVILHGYISGEEKKRIFEETSLFILPSYGEGMPIVLLEAMAFGCSIISTNVGAIPEIIKEENGILLSPGDIDGMIQAIRSLTADPHRMTAMQQNNLAKSMEFGIESNIKQLCDMYTS